MKYSDNPLSKYKNWFYTKMGENIKKQRKLCGDTQEALSDALGISRVSVNNIENGKQYMPLFLLFRLAKLLNTTVDGLIPKHDEYTVPHEVPKK